MTDWTQTLAARVKRTPTPSDHGAKRTYRSRGNSSMRTKQARTVHFTKIAGENIGSIGVLLQELYKCGGKSDSPESPAAANRCPPLRPNTGTGKAMVAVSDRSTVRLVIWLIPIRLPSLFMECDPGGGGHVIDRPDCYLMVLSRTTSSGVIQIASGSMCFPSA